jgi:glutamate dehydrogenase
LLSPFERAAAGTRTARYLALGAPSDVAEAVALLRPLTAVCDIADLAREARWDAPAAGRLYYKVGEAFGFERLRAAAAAIPARDSYERQAVRELVLEMLTEQAARVQAIMATAKRPPADLEGAIAAWTGPRRALVDRARRVMEEIEETAEGWSLAKLAIANAAVRAATARTG